jgi:hypothetical protein
MGRNEADAVRSACRMGKNADEYKEFLLEKEFIGIYSNIKIIS